MKKKNMPLKTWIMRGWGERMEAMGWAVGEDSLRRWPEAEVEKWEEGIHKKTGTMSFLGEINHIYEALKKGTFCFHVEWNQNHLPRWRSKAFSQYQCPFLILFNIECILEIILAIGLDSWLLYKGELSNHIWATIWDKIGCNTFHQDGLTQSICLNLAAE